MTIKSLIEQPVLLRTFMVTSLSDSYLFTMNLPDIIFEKSPFIKDKLKGYLGVKGDIVLRLVVNADKHTSGRYILFHHLPAPQGAQYFERVHHQDHQLSTQMPNVQVDINTETECLLRIPHCSPYSHFNLLTGQGDWGMIEMRKLLPHRGNEASFSLFASFENVELVGPTAIGGFVAQSDLDVTTIKMKPREVKLQPASFKNACHAVRRYIEYLLYGHRYVAQGGLGGEESNVPLSRRLGSVSKIATTMSGVPLLSSFLGPIAWASAVASNVASAFGYSKPLNTKSGEIVIQDPFHGINHCDGVDWAQPLATSAQACVQVDPAIGTTEQDEMSFKFLTQIRSSIHRIEWGTGAVAGTKLFSMPLSPRVLAAQSGTWSLGEAIVAHPICYLSHLFEYYRGSLEITVVISKTIFHTGRLMLVFEPGVTSRDGVGTPMVQTLADVNPCHKDIVDIRTTNTFSVKLPFTSLTPYLHANQPYGHFHIFVVNPLVRNAESVTDVVDAMIFVNGCDDWEFNGPCQPKVWPLQTLATAKTSVRSFDCFTLDDENGYVAQGGLEVTKDESEGFAKVIGTACSPSECHDSAKMCMGEKITSLKQVAMRAKLVSRSGFNLVDDPFSISPIYTKAFDGSPGFDKVPYRDFYSYVGALYRYSRGGMIFTAWNHGPKLSKFMLSNSFYDGEHQPTYIGVGDLNLEKWIQSGGTGRIYVPPYHQGLRRYTYSGQRLDSSVPNSVDAGVSNVKLSILTHSDRVYDGTNVAEDTACFIWRSAAEDTQFGGFHGVPLLTTPNSGPDIQDPKNWWFSASSV